MVGWWRGAIAPAQPILAPTIPALASAALAYVETANILPVVCQDCMIAPQNFESARGLPVRKLWLHLSSLALVSLEGESFDIDVYETYNNLFSIKLHFGGRFTDSPNKQYADGEFCFVGMLDIDDFKVDILNSVMCSIGYEDDDELLLYYKIPLKSLDVGLKQVVSETDISNKNFKGYVKNHKIMDFYLGLVEKTKSSSDEDGQSDIESE
ncbi:hypothetical protein Tco_1476195 [Tanacetum coccineum]